MENNKKLMGLKEIVLLNIVTVFGVTFFTSAAKMGSSQILLWIFASILFFIPEGLTVVELSTTWPINGGLSAWTTEAFGKKAGFITSWIYFIDNAIYFPALLMSTSVFFAYTIGMKSLPNSKVFICIFCIAFIWLLTFINIKGFDISKKISTFSSIFAFGITFLLVVLALYWVFGLKQPVQTKYTFSDMIPKISDLNSLVFFSTMLFALAGLELPPTVIGRMKDPEKNYPKAILISSLILPVLFMLGTTAITVIMSPDKVGLTTGMINAIDVVCGKANIGWFVILIALITLIFRVGAVNAWTLSPVVMFVEGSKDIMPSWFTKTDEKSGTPKTALIIQATLVSLLTLMSYSMKSAESAYWLLAAMGTTLYFIPYMVMFASFIALRIKKKDVVRKYKVPAGIFVASVGFLVVAVSTVLACLPPDGVNVGQIFSYELKLVGGALIFIAMGYVFYAFRKKTTTKNAD